MMKEINPYVEGINKILNNLDYYKSNARNRILNGFTIDNMIDNMDKVFEKINKKPNIKKIESANKMKDSIDITKELITKYFISMQDEYKWLAKNFNDENVDIDFKLEKEENKTTYYENTLEYKIKHPFYVILKKLHIYDYAKKILKRGEK